MYDDLYASNTLSLGKTLWCPLDRISLSASLNAMMTKRNVPSAAGIWTPRHFLTQSLWRFCEVVRKLKTGVEPTPEMSCVSAVPQTIVSSVVFLSSQSLKCNGRSLGVPQEWTGRMCSDMSYEWLSSCVVACRRVCSSIWYTVLSLQPNS